MQIYLCVTDTEDRCGTLEPGAAAIGVQAPSLDFLRKAEVRDFDGSIVVHIGQQNVFRLHKHIHQYCEISC